MIYRINQLESGTFTRGVWDVALIVLSAGAFSDNIHNSEVTAIGGLDVLAEVVMVHDEMQQKLVNLSTTGKLVTAEKSGHEIHWYRPELVIVAIQTILEQERGKCVDFP
jgi:hypothetical protein